MVDGRLDDPGWNLAPAVTDFRQTDPDEGAPVSEATAVRVLYDGTAVYVGARLFDSAPARIVRRLARRDASTHSDEFRVFLDSYHDRRTAFEFVVNAAGVKKDVLIGDDGDSDDASWDPVWEAALAEPIESRARRRRRAVSDARGPRGARGRAAPECPRPPARA